MLISNQVPQFPLGPAYYLLLTLRLGQILLARMSAGGLASTCRGTPVRVHIIRIVIRIATTIAIISLFI